MSEPFVSYIDPSPLAGELAAVSAALAIQISGDTGLASAANEIKSLLLALLGAATIPTPDFNSAWAISSAGNQVSVLGEYWSLTAHCVAGLPLYVQVMADDRLLSFDFSVSAADDGSPVDLHASTRTIAGEGAGFTFHADGRIVDDSDWPAMAADGLREAGEDVDAMPGIDSDVATGGDMAGGSGLNDALRGAAAVLGAAGAGAIIGGIIKKIGNGEGGLSPTASPPVPPATVAPTPVASPAPSWHYALAGKTLGPVDEAELRDRLFRGELARDTLVWHPDLPEWRKASTVGLVAATPPPLPPAVSLAPTFHSPVPQASPRDNHCAHCHQQLEPDMKFCSGCGKPVVAAATVPVLQTCPRCAAPLDPGIRFCTGCGISLT